MAYVVLARKWRPQRFEDVVGQEHITGTLANAIAQNRVAHGYLFCGPRGVGKTTTARILAKALNCETGPTPTPCNVCAACKDVDNGTSFDILEVDGASTRGIDDIRELRDNARYTPTGGRTKVYIIDEVHMLTREAFNALLKTLEEPPPHVIFVMATTEAYKVPATILSRCQRFDFARIHPKAVADRLKHICAEEGISIEDDAVAVLARRSAGGLRDALSSLDQVLASATETKVHITEAMVDRVLGILSSDFYFGLTDKLIDGDAAGALHQLDDAWHGGADLAEIAEELARHFRNVMVAALGPASEGTLAELGSHEIERLRGQAARVGPVTGARLLEVALRALNVSRRSEQVRLHLEMAIVELSQVSRALSLGEVARKLAEMEQRLGGAPAKAAPAPKPAPPATKPAPPAQPMAAAPPPDDVPPPEDGPAAPADPAALWQKAVAAVGQKKRSLGAFLAGSRATAFDAAGRLVIEPDPVDPMSREHLEDGDNRRIVEPVLREIAGRPVGYVVAAAPAAVANAAPAEAMRSPFDIAAEHPIVQKALDLFDGEITS
jgi:DNA polymerase-3 subunit gamma/tau